VTGFRFVSEHAEQYPVLRLCALAGVNRSGYYQWKGRCLSQRALADGQLLVVIQEIYKASRNTYGVPRVHDQLKQRQIGVGRKRVARLMAANSLVGVTDPKRFRYKPRDVALNRDRVNRDFTCDVVDGLWVADMTRFTTRQGHGHLAAVLDIKTKRIVGWSLSRRRSSGLVAAAVQMAHTRRIPGSRPIHHSDHGSEYTATMFTDLLGDLDIEMSLGSVGDCYDNAAIESFWATMKREIAWIHGTIAFDTHKELQAAVFDYIEVFYNNQRHQLKLGGLTPNQYYQKVIAA
jgi:transposase InsO family protein